MKNLKEAIEETAGLGKRLLAETPGLQSLSFQMLGYPVDEVKEVARLYKTHAEFSESHSRLSFMVSIDYGNIYIHVYSVVVKAKVVYE